MKAVYHYTDKTGFDAITNGNNWYPSTMIKHDFNKSLDLVMSFDTTKATKQYYARQYEQHDYREKKSTKFRDVDYGPGWYVTEIPPTAKTKHILDELWQGNGDYVNKTKYWLKIVIENRRLKQPAEKRKNVCFLPLYDRRGFDTNRPAGWSTSPVLLTEAGHRNDSKVSQLKFFKSPLDPCFAPWVFNFVIYLWSSTGRGRCRQ